MAPPQSLGSPGAAARGVKTAPAPGRDRVASSPARPGEEAMSLFTQFTHVIITVNYVDKAREFY